MQRATVEGTATGLWAPLALLPDGWAEAVEIRATADGAIAEVRSGVARPGAGASRADGPVLPAIPNVHSHAFQFALAGLAEHSGPGRRDSFWTWRETMYRFLQDLDPDGMEAIATRLYRLMRARGYGWVGEFHYVHHAPDGRPYANPAETGLRLLRAAETAGIGITLLPVYYEDGGFGGQPAGAGQRRFLNDPDGFARLLEILATACRGRPDRRLGIAPHSLRAVRPDRLAAVLAAADSVDPGMPIHIHAAEQRVEVEDCLAWSGRRPVRLLLDDFDLDQRWCLIHATHLDPGEIRDLAASGAVVGLCPATEANLGDGIFPAEAYLEAGGAIAIGSDSHVCVDPAEEVRWLENTQRLSLGRRTVLADGPDSSVGVSVMRRICAGGAVALAAPAGAIAPGRRFDLVELPGDPDHDAPPFEIPIDRRLDRWLFGPERDTIMHRSANRGGMA